MFFRYFFLICLLFLSDFLNAKEKILSFHSDIVIQNDGNLDVVETIVVKAEGGQIQRGIYRDFPIQSKQRFGVNFNTTFELVEVKRDDVVDSYHIENGYDSVRVYIGREDIFLNPGIYTYKIHYKSNYQLGHSHRNDRLLWNVTGNEWDFPIDKASATVTLPVALPESNDFAQAYTGFYGENEKNYQMTRLGNNQLSFKTTMPLQKNQGLTINIQWPKGYIKRLSKSDYETIFLPELIKSLDSELLISSEGRIKVKEAIKVFSRGELFFNHIRRKLYLSNKPTILAKQYNASVKVDSVKRNGQFLDFDVEYFDDGFYIYLLNDKSVTIPKDYDYEIVYMVDRQIEHTMFNDHLTWTIQNDVFDEVIRQSSIRLIFPESVSSDSIDVKVYEDDMRYPVDDFRLTHTSDRDLKLSFSQSLRHGKALSIDYVWEKGFVTRPGLIENIKKYVLYNAHKLLIYIGLLVFLTYYFLIWWRFGKDPDKGVVCPHYYPPQSLAPDALNYIHNKCSYRTRAFTAQLVYMASKGYFTIKDAGQGFELSRVENVVKPDKEYKAIVDLLFTHNDKLIVNSSYREFINIAMLKHEQLMNEKYFDKYYKKNKGHHKLPIVFSIMLFFGLWFIHPSIEKGFFLVWYAFLLFAIGFLFSRWMPSFTIQGRKLKDKIEGFYEFLSVSEEHDYRLLEAPDMSKELYEEYLPYAIAFNLEQQWGNRFSRYLSSSMIPEAEATFNWYDAPSYKQSAALFTGLSFATAIVDAALPESSNSDSMFDNDDDYGSGGSSYSGGGGGGGGGGGW